MYCMILRACRLPVIAYHKINQLDWELIFLEIFRAYASATACIYWCPDHPMPENLVLGSEDELENDRSKKPSATIIHIACCKKK